MPGISIGNNISIINSSRSYWPPLTGLVATLLSDGIRLDWPDNNSASQGYQVFVSTNGGSTFNQLGADIEKGTKTYKHSTTVLGAYIYKVRAILKTGYSDYSNLSGVFTKIVDTFTGTDAVRLSSHTMDYGPGWTEESGQWQLSSNKAINAKTPAAPGTCVVELGNADMDVSVDMYWNAGQSFALILYFRYSTGTNYWYAGFERDGAGAQPYFTVNKGATNMIQTNLAMDQVHRLLRVYCKGNVIKVYSDGVLIYSVTDATYNTNTKIAISDYRDATYDGAKFDNLNAVASNLDALSQIMTFQSIQPATITQTVLTYNIALGGVEAIDWGDGMGRQALIADGTDHTSTSAYTTNNTTYDVNLYGTVEHWVKFAILGHNNSLNGYTASVTFTEIVKLTALKELWINYARCVGTFDQLAVLPLTYLQLYHLNDPTGSMTIPETGTVSGAIDDGPKTLTGIEVELAGRNITVDFTKLPSILTFLSLSGIDVYPIVGSGSIADLSRGITILFIFDVTGITGVDSDFPPDLTLLQILNIGVTVTALGLKRTITNLYLGQITATGLLTDFPSGITWMELQGTGATGFIGSILQLPNYANLTHLRISGQPNITDYTPIG